MPSIPQSLLWISLVVLWLFVLVPMLISKRDAVRRTSDVALATRVLNSGAAARLLRRGGPAAGHRSDPDWQPDEYADPDDEEDADTSRIAAAPDGPDYLDVDVVDEDSGAVPAGDAAGGAEPVAEDEAELDDAEVDETDVDEPEDGYDKAEQDADLYEYVEDTSGLEAGEEPPTAIAPAVARRHQYDSRTAAAVSVRKYAFRRRMLMTMALALAASTAAAFTITRDAWWVCGSVGGVMVLYLGYLRRQTRIEARLCRRRIQRMARSRLGVENTRDREFDVVPSRLRRPGAVVLEIDDEDPVFEHLDYAPFAREYYLPRAVGQ